jgi:hypothetical protein
VADARAVDAEDCRWARAHDWRFVSVRHPTSTRVWSENRKADCCSVSAVSFVRLTEIISGKDYSDVTWAYCNNIIWWWVILRFFPSPHLCFFGLSKLTSRIFNSLVEMNVGVICACLPSLKSFVKHYFPNVFQISHNRPENERVNFSVFTGIPVHLSSWSGRRTHSANDTETASDSRRGSLTTDSDAWTLHANNKKSGTAVRKEDLESGV